MIDKAFAARSCVFLAVNVFLTGCGALKLGDASAPPSAAASPAAAASAVATAASAASGAAKSTAPATPGAKPATPGASTAATPPAPPPPPGSPPPFDTVAKDAKKTDTLFPVWRKEERVWIELRPEDFNKPFLLSPKISRGIGEKSLFGGLMIGPWGFHGGSQLVEFRRVYNQVRLIALNTDFIAKPGTPEARAVASAFSESLMSSAPVASSPHAERKSVLVDAAALFMTDISGMGMTVQRAYRQGYSLDRSHSGIDNVRGDDKAMILDITQHFYSPTLTVQTPGQPAPPPGAPVPLTPQTLPDARSFFIGLNLSLSKLPDVPMAARKADARVGYFTTLVDDFGSDVQRTPRQRYVKRWRLEKKDPAAALSEPVKPITYWLDRNIPLAYRAAITEGVLEWNKAFEKIGFKDAIVVKQQPDDATWDTLDPGVASIRWMTNYSPSFGAIGPSHTDPRTGEILDADIAFESLSSRNLRALRSQIIKPGFSMDWAGLLQARDAAREGSLPAAPGSVADPSAASGHRHGAECQHGEFVAEQVSYALMLLESWGNLDPNAPEVQQFVLDYLKDTTMHEVGHTLGLRHNFRSSVIYSESQLSDEAFTRGNGLAGSVMEYAPINLPRPGEIGGTRWQLTLGPYDFWAIEYAYKPIDAKDEAAELQRIAARSAEPGLAYATDEDSFIGIDPEALTFDLGSDPVAFARKRFDIGRDLVSRQDARSLMPDANYSVLRRSVTFAVRDMGRAAGVLARQIGGLRTLRDHPGSGRDPLQPVAAGVQRAALEALATGILSADSLKVSAALRRRLAPDYDERLESFSEGAPLTTDLSVDDLIGQLRKAVLTQLMTDGVATRILENEQKVGSAEAFRLSELYARLTREIWSELDAKGDIPGPRRELQREHVNRLAAQMLRPATSRTDSRSLLRLEAQALAKRLERAALRTGLSPEARAHLDDSRETLNLALAARLQRAGL